LNFNILRIILIKKGNWSRDHRDGPLNQNENFNFITHRNLIEVTLDEKRAKIVSSVEGPEAGRIPDERKEFDPNSWRLS
jgi:hypothetical protein